MENIFKDIKEEYKLGGLYGSSANYIISNIANNFDNTIIVLNNNSEVINFNEIFSAFVTKKKNISLFLDIEGFPYENSIQDIYIISERLKSYYNLLHHNNNNIIVTTYSSIIKKVINKKLIKSYFKEINKETKYNTIINILKDFKYERTDKVLNKGEYSIKGPIIDIYNLLNDKPIRINFDGDKVQSIKEFDINNQRSINEVDFLFLSPAVEFIIDDKAIKNYKKNVPLFFDQDYINDIEYSKVVSHYSHPHINNILPLFNNNLMSFIDFPGCDHNVIISNRNISNQLKKIYERYIEYYNKNHEIKYILEPSAILTNPKDIQLTCLDYFKIELSNYKVVESHSCYNSTIRKLPSLVVDNKSKDPYLKLKNYINSSTNKLLIFIERKSLQLEVKKLLDDLNISLKIFDNVHKAIKAKEMISIVSTKLDEGFIDFSSKITFISSKDIFGNRSVNIPKKNSNRILNSYINDISVLDIDDPLVHDNYGVGRYKGLINMDIEGIETELIKIEYANDDMLYIPVTSIGLLKKYVGHTGVNIPLHSLGTDNWIKIKKRANKKIRDIAVELLEIESKRSSSIGVKFNLPKNEFRDFVDDFPYEETEDQNRSINDVIADMCSKQIMDRLICGDVGFGKTEIIMRAAFIAASNNSQVMILAPTTLLVEQHFKSFTERFTNTLFSIGKLSRLQSSKERRTIIDNLSKGNIDIIIGTHALLSKNIIFKNLKLLIIDEEHKFGVSDKEKIKKMRYNIDVISLTATPIPRTLNSALSQFKDLSVIETPPQNRKPIVTRIAKWDDSLIIDAITREVNRGGQIYYVHNEVRSIEQEIHKLESLNIGLSIGIIHGQLDSKIIEIEMDKFLNRKYDILVSTSIIESGLDIPNVNTIIINNCNKFGLAQLHQIRGRVGRTNRQAYAYLIIPDTNITKDAEKRLLAIDSINSLGGGLELATHDLEIRGAGEILGEEQSGQIYEIGYAMFTDMLRKSIELLKNGNITSNIDNIEIDSNYSCLITEEYMSDILSRLKYYRKISSCENEKDIIHLKDELIDIYGPIPEYLDNLLYLTNLKIKLKNKNIKYMKIIDYLIKIEFKNKDLIILDNIVNSTKKMDLKIMKNNLIQLNIDAVSFESLCIKIASIISRF